MELLDQRLTAQRIGGAAATKPEEVVGWLGAVQAQDYAGTKWAVALRCVGQVTESDVERALAAGTILRTHAMRFTWQLVLPRDVRWMTALVAPRLVARAARRHQTLGLDAATFRKSNALLDKATRGRAPKTRDELAKVLQGAGISTEKERLSHLLGRAEIDAVLCSGPRRGKQFTYVHLDDRAPAPRTKLRREESLAELARIYYRSRGPATVADFVWWSGFTVADARAGIEALGSSLGSERREGVAYFHLEEPRKRTAPRRRVAPRSPASGCHFLPPFDEYLVAYRNREALLDPREAKRLNAGGGMLNASVLLGGKVIGTWRRELERDAVVIDVDLFTTPSRSERDSIREAAERYGVFLGLDVRIARISAKKR